MLSRWFLGDNFPFALCTPYHYDIWLIVASYVIAASAAYTSFHLVTRVREADGLSERTIWLGTAGVSMGLGIWAMHFIAMLAVEIPITIRFDLPLTGLSAGFAIVASTVALQLVSHETTDRIRLAIAGVVLGAGVGLMHYVGMAALQMAARIYYAPWPFVLSLAVAVVLSTMALYTLMIIPRVGDGRVPRARLAGAAVMGLAIVLMHYTGMFATWFYPLAQAPDTGALLDRTVMAGVIGVVTLLIIGLALVAALLDGRVKRAERMLRDAVNSISEGFVIFDRDDRIVMSNDAFKKFHRDSISPEVGTRIEDNLRSGLARGHYLDAIGREDEWLAARLKHYREATGSFEQHVSNGSWVLLTDRRMANGGTAGLRVDISALKAAQSAISESERRLRDFAEMASDWFWEQDTDLRFVWFSDTESFIRRGPTDNHGKTRWELGANSATPEQWEAHKADLAARRPFRDFRYVRVESDGMRRAISVNGGPVFAPSGEFLGYRGTGRDITAQVEAETELRLAKEKAEHAETLLRDAVDSFSDGFVIYDQDDRLVMCNQAYRRMYPESADILVPGTHYLEIARRGLQAGKYPDAIGREDEWIAARIRQRQEGAGSFERQLSDGSWVLSTDQRTSNGGIAGLRIDISALKQAHAALRDSEERLDRAQEIAGIGSWEFDVSTGRRLWSKEMYRIRGDLGDDNEPTIRGLEPFTHPDDRGRFVEWLDALKQGRPQEPLEYRIIRSDGEPRVVRAEARPVANAAGVVTTVAGTLQDISERRRTEQQLIQAQKMETVGQLTGGLAHDFNNILGAVIGNLDLAMENAARGADPTRFCQVALDASLSAAELVKRLLAFSRRQALRPRPTDLEGVIATVLPLVERALGEHIRVETKIAPLLWPVLADTAQLESAILNLALNARDAMPDTGKLTIEVCNTVLDGTQTTAAGTLAAGDYALIAISDTGVGMAPDVLTRAFDPFFSTKGPGAGSGLGLSMVQGTMQQLGGAVQIDSEPGAGTTVRLYLPRSSGQEDAVVPSVAETIPVRAGREHVLLVEDNAQIRTMAAGILRGLGYQVTVAESGDDAMERITDGERFDLVFTDIVMPGRLNGIALARALRARGLEVPILFTSGFSSPETLRSDIDSFDARLIGKPYRKAELAAAIRDTLHPTAEGVV